MTQVSDSGLVSATKEKTTFNMEYRVSIEINADLDKIWSILTTGSSYTNWNSTITSLEGNIQLGDTINLKTTLDAKRTFKLKVSEFEKNKKMVWKSGMPLFKGVRTYTLDETGSGAIRFTMSEAFSGLMLPMIAGSLPDFTEAFEQFAQDLKKEAEKE